MDKNEALQVIRSNYPTDRNQLCEALKTLIPELKETEDERIRKYLIGGIKHLSEKSSFFTAEVSKGKVIAWLEKQGKQKADKCEGCNNIKGCVTCTDGDQYVHITEQKPTDKVEPKFHEGEWVQIDRGNAIKILEVEEIPCYKILNYYGGESIRKISDIDSIAHSWTIRDAKDGDVIAFDNSTIVIFKDLYNATTFHSYCHIENDIFNISKDDMPDWWEGEGFHPATKEQHDLLFQRMEEAGYEWDAIKKELKKIEQKPSTSVTEFDAEIERFCKECFITDANERDWVFCIARHFADWQKNRKNPAWSEEDKNMLQNILECLKNGWSKLPTDILKYESWLKSIKERYTWRPSDEQMEALYTYIYNPQYFNSLDPRMELVESVYKDLKKLKEE